MQKKPFTYLSKAFIVLGLTVIVYIVVYTYILCAVQKSDSHKKGNITLGCVCKHENIAYDFCYHLPENKSIYGKAFDCNNAHYLKKLHLLPDKNYGYIASQAVNTLTRPVMVTAISNSYLELAQRMLASIRQFWPQQVVLVYDIGLDDDQVKYVQKLCNVVYRKFNFTAYPDYVQMLHEYRWKPLIIAEVLNEYKALWWLDVSVRFRHHNLSKVYDLYRCKQSIKYDSLQRLCGSAITSAAASRKACEAFPYSTRRLQRSKILGNCTKADFLLHSDSSHSNFAATYPDFYRYIPSNIEKLKETKQLEANLMLLADSADVRHILRWVVACALQEDCLGRGENFRYFSMVCAFEEKNRYTKFANCHRFDQSAFNIILANEYFYEHRYYESEQTYFFEINRQATEIFTEDMLKCN